MFLAESCLEARNVVVTSYVQKAGDDGQSVFGEWVGKYPRVHTDGYLPKQGYEKAPMVGGRSCLRRNPFRWLLKVCFY
jgi:hypothetical protein